MRPIADMDLQKASGSVITAILAGSEFHIEGAAQTKEFWYALEPWGRRNLLGAPLVVIVAEELQGKNETGMATTLSFQIVAHVRLLFQWLKISHVLLLGTVIPHVRLFFQ